MTSRERIRQLYYGDKKPGSKKYLLIGVLAIVVVLALFFVFGGGGGTPPIDDTTSTTEGSFDLDGEVASIRNKLTEAVNDISNIQQRSGASASPPITGTGSAFSDQIDSMIAKIE